MKDEWTWNSWFLFLSSFIPHPFDLADLARFERATSTFAESRSHSAELQVQEFWILDFGMRTGVLKMQRENKSAIRNGKSEINIGGRLGSRTLHGQRRHSFQDCLTRSTVGPSKKLAGTLGFEPRISDLETDGLPLAYIPKEFSADFILHPSSFDGWCMR